MARRRRAAAAALLACGALLACEAQMDGGQPCNTHDEFQRRVEQVATNCCDQFDQEANCASGVPEICDTRCAPVFTAFWTACADYISTSLASPSIRQQFTATHGRCHATMEANEVHDTDLIAPGEQHDLNAKLAVPVNCHQQQAKTAQELDANTGPMDSLWIVGVKGETTCMYPKGPGTAGGYETEEEHQNCPVLVNKQRVQDLLLARYGECVEHHPAPPPPGEHGHDLVHPRIEVISSGGVAGHSTYQLSLKFQTGSAQGDVHNVYTIYGAPAVTAGPSAGEPAHSMYFPPAYQEPTPFGANIGGTNPMFWGYSASTEFDSWLAVGDISGSSATTADVSSIGIDFDSWDEKTGVTVENGAVFWMDPTKAPSSDPCVVAQLTIKDGVTWSATVNARGKLGDYSGGGGDDWEATNLVFSDADVPAWEAGDGEGEGHIEDGGGHRRVQKGLTDPDGPPAETAPGEGGMANMICDFSLDTNEDGVVGPGDDEYEMMPFFGAILSKDAVFYLATDAAAAPLIEYVECDEVVGGRRQLAEAAERERQQALSSQQQQQRQAV